MFQLLFEFVADVLRKTVHNCRQIVVIFLI